MARKLEHIDSRVLGVSWSPGTVHLYIDGQDTVTMSPEVAAWLAETARVCLVAALKADPTATAEDWVHELLTTQQQPMNEAEFQQLTGGTRQDG